MSFIRPVINGATLTGTMVKPDQIDKEKAIQIRQYSENNPNINRLYSYQDGGPDKLGHNIYLRENFMEIT